MHQCIVLCQCISALPQQFFLLQGADGRKASGEQGRSMRVHASLECPPTVGATWEERWEGPDRGLYLCWLKGVAMAGESPALADAARSGSLPVLPWRGGVEKAVKALKLGSVYYLAMWQGLRGDDLSVSLEEDVIITCSRTGTRVRFTPQLLAELAAVPADEEQAP